MSSVAPVPTQTVIAGKPEVVNKVDGVARQEDLNQVTTPAKRGRKPGSVQPKKKPSASQKSIHYFQVERGYKPGPGKPPTVVKDFRDENEAYRECFKAGSLCIRGELFSVDIVGKTLTEIPVQAEIQPE